MQVIISGGDNLKRGKQILSGMLLVMIMLMTSGCNTDTPKNSIKQDSLQQAEQTSQEQCSQEPLVRVEGRVEKPYDCNIENLADKKVNIKAIMRKCSETCPEQAYSGVPLHVIITAACPDENATKLTVEAADGYNKNFVFEDVIKDNQLILISENNSVSLAAGNSEKYDASYWVQNIVNLKVE